MKARYKLVKGTQDSAAITIEDIGWEECRRSITNDAEAVVEDLVRQGWDFSTGLRLFYIDSDGITDEILVDCHNQFAGFNIL
jgi:hypothetical protein